MKQNPELYRVYAITDRKRLNGKTLETAVEEAILGGVTLIQIREKNISEEEYIKRTRSLLEITRKYNVPLIVNDNIDVALKSGADGVHLGQDDLPSGGIRKKLGDKLILGVSAHNVEEALRAQELGADYLGSGAVFPTSSKNDVSCMKHETLKNICASVNIPVVGIGGITRDNIKALAGSGIAGVSVISAVFAAENIKAAAAALSEEVNKIIQR